MATLMNYTADTASSTNPTCYYKLTATETARTSTSVTIKFTAYAYLKNSQHC